MSDTLSSPKPPPELPLPPPHTPFKSREGSWRWRFHSTAITACHADTCVPCDTCEFYPVPICFVHIHYALSSPLPCVRACKIPKVSISGVEVELTVSVAKGPESGDGHFGQVLVVAGAVVARVGHFLFGEEPGIGGNSDGYYGK